MPDASPPIRLFLGGAAKSGTTALLRYLAAHPQVVAHEQREMPYFAREEEFAAGYAAACERYFPGAEQGVRVAKHAMAMYSETAMRRLAAHDPTTELVIVLRNPVDRAYSHYWFARMRGWERAESFEAAIERPEPALDVDHRTGNQLAYLADGVYAPHVRVALDLFGDRVTIHLSSDLRSCADEIVRRHFERLGVDPTLDIDTGSAHNKTARARSETLARLFLRLQQPENPIRRVASRIVPSRALYHARYRVHRLNQRSAEIPEMAASTRARLVEHFAGHNEELAALIGRDLQEWHR